MSELAPPQPGSSGLPNLPTENADLKSEPGKRKLFVILLSFVLFFAGTATGFGWYSYRNNEVVRPIERKLRLTIYVRDENCDSGINSDWFKRAFLANESGKKIQTLGSATFDLECSKLDELRREYYIVNPTDSWIYRIVLFNTQEMLSQEVLQSTTVVIGDDTIGLPEITVFVSADCSGTERLCEY